MNDFVSVLDMKEHNDTAGARALRDELAELDLALRRDMDTGLTPEEMVLAQASRQAVQAASGILTKLF